MIGTLPFKVDAPYEPFVAHMKKPKWDTFFMALAYLYCTRSPDQQTKAGCTIVDWPSKMVIGMGYNGFPRGVDGLPTMREGSVLCEELEISDRMTHAIKKFYLGQVVPKELRSGVTVRGEDVEKFLQQSPDKYPTMIHSDMNAVTNIWRPSSEAVGYLPFEPCENCFLAWLARTDVKFSRIVILSSRPFPNYERLVTKLGSRAPMVSCIGPNIRYWRGIKKDDPESWAEFDPAMALFQAAQYCNLMIESSAELSKDSTKVYRKQS